MWQAAAGPAALQLHCYGLLTGTRKVANFPELRCCDVTMHVSTNVQSKHWSHSLENKNSWRSWECTAGGCPKLLLGERRVWMLGLLYRCLECLAASVMSQQQLDDVDYIPACKCLHSSDVLVRQCSPVHQLQCKHIKLDLLYMIQMLKSTCLYLLRRHKLYKAV